MDQVFEQAKAKMEKTLTALHNEFATMRAGKASASVLDKISVDYYGTPTPIQQIAAVSVQEGRILVIQPWDVTQIQASDLGINPMNDGKVIRLTFPPLTEERRKLLAKDVSKYAEEAKVSIRSTRRDIIDKIKKMQKDSVITEDDLKDGEKEAQDITDEYIKKIEELANKKEKEIMEI